MTCCRWPNKHAYATADAASLALRRIFEESPWSAWSLVGYACDGGDTDHWHLGRLTERERRGVAR